MNREEALKAYPYLSGADLSGANLSGADLSGANLYGADLSRANLYGAKNIPPLVSARLNIVPDGDIIVYKKCREGVVTLRIPKGARRSNATGRKCRAEYAIVVKTPGGKPATSIYSPSVKYYQKKRVTADGWTEDRFVECGQGIHFYLTEEEAKNH